MKPEDFDKLDEHEKQVLIFDAKKIAELTDYFSKYELYQIHDFFIETKTSKARLHKRAIKSYSLKDLPLIYGGVCN